MILNIRKRFTFYPALLFILLAVFTACSTGNLFEYSSIAGREQSVSHVRTEMFIIRGDNEKIKKDFSVVSAVDYLHGGKRVYYLMIVPSSSSNPKLEDLMLQYDYPYVLPGQNIEELISNIEKLTNEWDSTDLKYSGAVYNFYISSPQDTRPWFEEKNGWWEEKKFYEAVPYIKFSYSKDGRGAAARLAAGTRVDEIIYSAADGKTSKSKIFFKADEKSWRFDNSAEMKDFLNLLAKGLGDLRDKGMDGYYRKNEIKAEVKKEVPEVKTEAKTAEKKVLRKKRKK